MPQEIPPTKPPCRRPSELLESFRGTQSAAVQADVLLMKADDEHAASFSMLNAVAPPISVSTTFECRQDGEPGHIYSRITSPSRTRCEALLGSIEGVPGNPAHAVLYSSGLAACFAALTRLLPSTIAISGGYHGCHEVVAQLRRISAGGRFQIVPIPAVDQVKSALKEGDVIWLETPRNPDCVIYDIEAYVEAAKTVGARVVVDSTFAPPPLQRPLLLGVDMVMHSTTKYLAGHSDALGGALLVKEEAEAEQLREDRTSLGSTPGSLETWLLTRSLRTVHLRVERQSSTAAKLAQWLHAAVEGADAHPLAGFVHAVHHPSLKSHPSHAVAVRQMPGGFGGCFALELVSEKAAKTLPGVLTLFTEATSLGGVESLIEWRRKWDTEVSPLLLRVSVGLEDFEHLREDLQRAILLVGKS